MSGTLLKFYLLGVLLSSHSSFAQETKLDEVKPKTPPDNTAFVVALANKSAKMTAAVTMSKGTKDGDPTAQLFHRLEDADGNAIEAWVVSQKIKDAEAPIGRKLVFIKVYLTVTMKDKDGKELETPQVVERATRVAYVLDEDYPL